MISRATTRTQRSVGARNVIVFVELGCANRLFVGEEGGRLLAGRARRIGAGSKERHLAIRLLGGCNHTHVIASRVPVRHCCDVATWERPALGRRPSDLGLLSTRAYPCERERAVLNVDFDATRRTVDRLTRRTTPSPHRELRRDVRARIDLRIHTRSCRASARSAPPSYDKAREE